MAINMCKQHKIFPEISIYITHIATHLFTFTFNIVETQQSSIELVTICSV